MRKKNKTPFYRPALSEQEIKVLLDGLGIVANDLRERGSTGKYLSGVKSLERRMKRGLKRVNGKRGPMSWERGLAYT